GAQDYVGKSMAGGELVLRHRQAEGAVKGHVIAGNTVLYGATGGALFADGSVGERVCERNSGGTVVVVGFGDHGCEYMTGGAVVVLGRTGRNFAAGMSGGVAYVLDAEGGFRQRLNDTMVTATRLSATLAAEQEAQLRALLERHVAATGSPRAAELLADWKNSRSLFWHVAPKTTPAQAVDEA